MSPVAIVATLCRPLVADWHPLWSALVSAQSSSVQPRADRCCADLFVGCASAATSWAGAMWVIARVVAEVVVLWSGEDGRSVA